jgi:hypothetical protein
MLVGITSGNLRVKTMRHYKEAVDDESDVR